MANLPYVTATGNVKRALDAIAAAATPDSVSQNFVKTILKIPGGSGDQMTSFLKKIGLASTDGTPTNLYKKFRNQGTRGAAAAASLKIGYAPLYKRNEFLHELPDKDVKGLILEETGLATDSSVPGAILSCIKSIRSYADFEQDLDADVVAEKTGGHTELPLPYPPKTDLGSKTERSSVGLNIGYNINLNLPPTTDIAVFNAIFKSLKENLLDNDDG